MINEQIRDREVRLIGENGEQLGIMSQNAYKLKEAELDKRYCEKIIDYKYNTSLQEKKKKLEEGLSRSRKFVFPRISMKMT